jgi:hypothetical protein
MTERIDGVVKAGRRTFFPPRIYQIYTIPCPLPQEKSSACTVQYKPIGQGIRPGQLNPWQKDLGEMFCQLDHGG